MFIDKIYSKPPTRNYPTIRIVYNHIDEIWSIDLVDMIDKKISNNKEFRFIIVIIDNFSKHLWVIPLKNQKCTNINTRIFK